MRTIRDCYLPTCHKGRALYVVLALLSRRLFTRLITPTLNLCDDQPRDSGSDGDERSHLWRLLFGFRFLHLGEAATLSTMTPARQAALRDAAFQTEEEEARWWADNQDLMDEASEPAAETGSVSRTTVRSGRAQIEAIHRIEAGV